MASNRENFKVDLIDRPLLACPLHFTEQA